MIESPIQPWIAIPFRRYNCHTILKKKRSHFCQEHNARILLAGMEALPNYGEDYMREFEIVFPKLAKKHDLNYLPFLLEGVAGEREHAQPDGLHPLASGYRIVTDLVWQQLEPMLAATGRGAN